MTIKTTGNYLTNTAACFFLLSLFIYPDGITIIENSKPVTGLYILKNQDKVLEYAITDFQEHIEKSAGMKFQITDSVENPAIIVTVSEKLPAQYSNLKDEIDKLGEEGFIIKTDSPHIVISGNSGLGTAYGLYAFLEYFFGIRWFFDTSDGTVIPRQSNVTVKECYIKEKPVFKIRWVGGGKWALRNRMNVSLPIDNAGIVQLYGGHSFSKIIPPKEYFEKHPEYFAELYGKRVVDLTTDHRNQLCTSNPELIKEVIKNISAALDTNPAIRLVDLSPNDGDGFCDCEKCRALDEKGVMVAKDIAEFWNRSPSTRLSKRLFTFFIQVAKELQKKYPHVLIKHFAYQAYTEPPDDPSIMLLDNQVVQLCHGACQNHTFNDSLCPVNKAFNRVLEEWGKHAKHVMMYEYYHKLSWIGAPWAIIHSIRQDIPYLAGKKVDAFYTQCAWKDPWVNGHIYYLACKLLWNPGADSDKILDDFYKNMYGSAADDMKKYYDNYEKAFIDSAEHVANQTPLQQIGTIFTPAVMKKAEKHLADARKKQQDNFIMDRIEKQEIAYGYILRLVQAIQSAMEIIANSDQFWLFDPAGNNPKLHDKYNVCFSELASYIDKYQSENIFYGTGNNYHTKMINKTNMLNYAESDLAKASKGLDKKEYLASTKQTITKPDTTTESFDIWMYGNDWDSGENDGQTYEHFVYIIDPAGKRIEIGALGNLGDANADKVNRINIISNVSKNIIKACLDKNKDIKFLITNPSGAWTMSTFFAAYIMPPINKINNDYATWLVQKKVDWVRQASFGFRELSYQGEMLGENKEYEFLIPVTGRETAVPAMPVFFKE